MRQLIINVPMNMRDKANEILDLMIDADLPSNTAQYGVHAMTREGHLKSTVSANIVSIEWITMKPSNGIRDDD